MNENNTLLRDDLEYGKALRKGHDPNYTPWMEQEFDLSTRKKLTAAQRTDERNRLVAKFKIVPKVKDQILTLTTLDQAYDGACTIASLFNLLHIEGKDDLHPPKKVGRSYRPMTWNEIKKLNKRGTEGLYFAKKVYHKITQYKKETLGGVSDVQDYQETLQLGKKINIPVIENILNDESFRYVPVRSRINGERLLNFEVAGKDPKNFVKSIQTYIENLLNRGIPVGFSANGHARIIVGYNNEEVVMLDSWGDNNNMEQKELRFRKVSYQDKFKAGFSTMNKLVVYADMRDIIYFEPSESRIIQQEEIQNDMVKLKL
jgi:hypothetical protein